MVRTCAAYGCMEKSSPGSKISFHLFPLDPKVRKSWIDATKRLNFDPKSCYLCSKHFTLDCFGPKCLKRDAVPTVFTFPPGCQMEKASTKKLINLDIVETKFGENPAEMCSFSAKTIPFLPKNEIGDHLSRTESSESLNDQREIDQSSAANRKTIEPDTIVNQPISLKVWDLQNLNNAKICRTCLVDGDVLSLFTKCIVDNTEVFIPEMLYSCASIQVEQINDRFPTYICVQCLDELSKFYKFQQKCQKSEEFLNNLSTFHEYQKQEVIPSDTDSDLEQKTAEILPISEETNQDPPLETEFVEIVSENCVKTEEDSDFSWHDEDSPFLKVPQVKVRKKTNQIQSKRIQGKAKRNYQCNYCSKMFTRNQLMTHMRTHSGEKPYICEYCSKPFADKNNLARHIRIHTDERRYRCDQCGQAFIQSTSLVTHLKKHAQQEPNRCEICGSLFKFPGQLRKHVTEDHMDKDEIPTNISKDVNPGPPFKCRTCERVFSHRSVRFIHEKTHDIPKYLCNICGHSSRTLTLFTIHQRIHTGEKPHVCQICFKAFRQVNGLRNHIINHTGERAYACTVCEKTFKHQHGLRAHIRVHTDERRYSCKICLKRFRQHPHLAAHMRVHDGKKPYTCRYCNKSFAVSGTLTVHTRIHTGEKPYVCVVCDRGFYDSSTMKKHQVKVHVPNFGKILKND